MLIAPKRAWHWPCLFILWCGRWWIWVSHRPQCLCSPLNVIRSFSGFWNCLISTLVRMPYSNLGLCFFRLHRMWLIATDVTCSMIFVSVCLSVCSSHVLLHKNGWNSRDAILGADWWMWGQGTMYYYMGSRSGESIFTSAARVTRQQCIILPNHFGHSNWK